MENEKRLIDANKYPCRSCGKTYCHQNCKEFIEWLENTVDAVEVVHGRWIHVPSSDMMTGRAYKCSECGKMRYGSYMPNYCQCCGAKMEGDGNG